MDADFELLSGNPPFPWQRALYQRFATGDFPTACDLPTGLGKTSVIHLWLLALARNPRLPRRLVYVVNRRTVVDQASDEAERLAQRLLLGGARHLYDALLSLCAVTPRSEEAPLAISTLRGERADNAEWRRDPSRPAIIIGTVDMVGSRLLFGGYGCGFRSRPLHAGFLGQDALLVHDEAHLEPAFQELLVAIRREQLASQEPRPLHVLAMSATGRVAPDFALTTDDERHAVVRARLHAKKGLLLHDVDDKKELPVRVASRAAELEGKIVVFLSSVDHVEKCADTLRKERGKDQVAVLTGTLRGKERDELVKTPVFARFLPRPPEGTQLREGTVFLVATSAGEVGIDISADHLVSDLPPFDALAQRLGRVNRYGEGDASVDVYCERLKGPPNAETTPDDEEESEVSGKRKAEYDYARYAARDLLSTLPMRADGRSDVSPAALRALPHDSRRAASTPLPDIRSVDALLFDRWSYTTITAPLPGRPPVAEWLHGVEEWEPPRTRVAWRREVAWLDAEHLGRDSLGDLLADYPLRSRETLSDSTARVLMHLQKIVARDQEGSLRAWLVRYDAQPTFWSLVTLLERHDAQKNPLLNDATIVLSPEAGGLRDGLLDGDSEFVTGEERLYDLGPKESERLAYESGDEAPAPGAMRLVRSIRRGGDDGDENWWYLYVVSRRADDDGSRTRRCSLLLGEHLRRAEFWALRIAECLGLADSLRRALVCAARCHDLGKRRLVWQRSIKNFKEPPLAKGRMQPSDLSHYRHELGSLHDMLTEPGFDELSAGERELALHIVAAHHGRARPHFPPVESYDPEVKDDIVAPLVHDVPLRFDRLQREYGRWALAWLESLLRAADILASADAEESA